MKYRGKYYILSEKRIPYHRDKTDDDRFFVLTLFAIANGLSAANIRLDGQAEVELAVGLPPAHYGAQNRAFTEYFPGAGYSALAIMAALSLCASMLYAVTCRHTPLRRRC